MFKRMLRICIFTLLIVSFPLVMLYQFFEAIFVCPIFYIVKGKRYMDLYYPFVLVYVDLCDCIFCEEDYSNVTFKRKYYHD